MKIVGGLYFDVSGSGDPVVLLHAGGMDSRMWDEQVAALSGEFTIVRCDMRGAGHSERPREPYSATDDVVTVLRHLDIRRAAIVGASLGGRTALDLTLDHPELVSSLVLAGAGLGDFPFSVSYQQMMVSILGPLALGNVDGFATEFLRSALGPVTTESLPLVRRMLVDNQFLFAGDAALLRPSAPPASGLLGSIHVPTLVMVGDRDHEDLRAIANALAAAIKGSQLLTIAGAGHLLSFDRPEEFNRAVREFLEANRAAA